MTPAQKGRYGCEAAAHSKWRMTAPPNNPVMKRPTGLHQPWPLHTQPSRQIHRSYLPPPPPPAPPPLPSYHLPFFHTRHAEESAERPHLVTVVRPCGLNSLRKVTVLLNRRGVVSFEQLLLDISEALGFPRWHRARVTRLFTTHAREVKGICDFFRGEAAYLALGKPRPELSSVQEALEELYPEPSHYRAAALRSWEKRLTSTPDKAAKADSGYSEGADSSDTNQETKQDKSQVKSLTTPHHKDLQQFEKHHADIQKSHKKNPCRKPVCPPNHLQRLNVRVKGTGGFKHREDSRDSDIPSPTLCENCLSIINTQHVPERIDPLSGRIPLPPVSRKQRGSAEKDKVDVSLSPHPAKDKSPSQFQPSKPLPDVGSTHKQPKDDAVFCLPSEGSDVTLSDIERCYEIGRVVGDGNFAVVRECRRRDNQHSLALKIIERSKLIGREHMMQNELSLLGSLRHGRIVRLFAHHHTQTHSYLVMELVSGGDLFEAISERGKFSEAEAGLMVSDMSDALHYIHAKSIVHRDLKPENLLIERVGENICRLKLGDFGLAMVVTEPVFTICGTPTYVAPEILFETGYGVAVDVWALGVILYILLCGFPPFRSRDRDQEELFQLIKEGQLHFLSPYWDPISEEAKSLVSALLQPDPSVRLTAEQTMQHLWVKTTSSQCWQGAPAVKTQRNTVASRGETERVQNLAEAITTDSRRARRQGHGSSRGEDKDKNIIRPEDGRNESRRQTKGIEDKSLRPQSLDMGAVHTLSPSTDTMSERQKPDSYSPHGPEIQDLGPKQMEPRVELTDPTEPQSRIRTETKQTSQQQSAPSDNSAETIASTQHPSSEPTPPSPGSTATEP